MAFMTKKKKYRFQVDVRLDELIEVPLVSAVLFAKLRLLDGGNFQQYSTREEVKDHKVKWGAQFEFACKMLANASTGVLERCTLRISVRKEVKGGRSFQKLGFSDINLAELAGSHMVSKQYLLEGYDTRNRQDNSMLRITVKMNMLSGDILFKVPSPTSKLPSTVTTDQPNADGTKDEFTENSLAGSVGPGFGSLPKKRVLTDMWPRAKDSIDSKNADKVVDADSLRPTSHSTIDPALSHSRNSSSTSHVSKASNESSSGESSQNKPVVKNCASVTSITRVQNISRSFTTIQTNDASKPTEPVAAATTTTTHYMGLSQRQSSFTSVQKNPSGSSLNLLETGSLDRAKSALERRNKRGLDLNGHDSDLSSLISTNVATMVSGRVEVTRPDRHNLIEEIIASVEIEKGSGQMCLDSSGKLQLFIAKDGTAALGNDEVKSQISSGIQAFKEVVIDARKSSYSTPNHYEVLNLPPDCTQKEIKDAFIKLSKEFHPDICKDNQGHLKFINVSEAYHVLSKADTRRNYDYLLKRQINVVPSGNSYDHHTYCPQEFWEYRDRSKDEYYASQPYYGVKGVKKMTNRTILLGCLLFAAVGVVVQVFIIKFAFKVSRDALDKRSRESNAALAEVRKEAQINGNDVQLLKLQEKYDKREY